MDLIEQPDRADTSDLLCELCESRDARLFLSIVAAVDAGVDTARDKGEGDDLKERDAPHISEHGNTDKVCVFPDYKAGCEFPYKSRVMGTSEPLKPLKAPYMARNPVKWGFFRLKGQEIPLKI